MAGGAVVVGTTDTSRIEAPVTFKAYLMCAFAAFGGIFFGYDTGWMGGLVVSILFPLTKLNRNHLRYESLLIFRVVSWA